MLRAVKKWMLKAVNEAAMYQQVAEKQDYPVKAIDPRRPPPTMAVDVVSMMSTSMATIYRIDNGFIVSIHMNDDRHLGSRGSLVYAKDAAEIAEKIIANEAAFKMGIRGGEASVKVATPPAGYAPNTNRI